MLAAQATWPHNHSRLALTAHSSYEPDANPYRRLDKHLVAFLPWRKPFGGEVKDQKSWPLSRSVNPLAKLSIYKNPISNFDGPVIFFDCRWQSEGDFHLYFSN